MKAYSPTTCLAAGAERGVRILWNITGDSSRSALLQCCPAPTGAAVSMPISARMGGGGGGGGSLGSSRVILLHQSDKREALRAVSVAVDYEHTINHML